MRGVGAPRSFAAAVGAQIAVADVVGENEDDVGLLVLRGRGRGHHRSERYQ